MVVGLVGLGHQVSGIGNGVESPRKSCGRHSIGRGQGRREPRGERSGQAACADERPVCGWVAIVEVDRDLSNGQITPVGYSRAEHHAAPGRRVAIRDRKVLVAEAEVPCEYVRQNPQIRLTFRWNGISDNLPSFRDGGCPCQRICRRSGMGYQESASRVKCRRGISFDSAVSGEPSWSSPYAVDGVVDGQIQITLCLLRREHDCDVATCVLGHLKLVNTSYLGW